MTPPRGVAAADIAVVWQLPIATVYWLASEHDWRRYRSGRRVFYHPDDVTGTLDGRAAREGPSAQVGGPAEDGGSSW